MADAMSVLTKEFGIKFSDALVIEHRAVPRLTNRQGELHVHARFVRVLSLDFERALAGVNPLPGSGGDGGKSDDE